MIDAPTNLCADLRSSLEETLFNRLQRCVRDLYDWFSRKAGADWLWLISETVGGAEIKHDAITQHDAYCRLRQSVINLYLDNPLNFTCTGIGDRLRYDDVQRPDEKTDPQVYAQELSSPVGNLLALIVEYLIDCVCGKLLPGCATDPCDDRLILACVTVDVTNGEVLKICNFGCRRYAGSFPAVKYWASLVPIIPLIGWFVTQLCCNSTMLRVPGRGKMASRRSQASMAAAASRQDTGNRLMQMVDTIDPGGSIRQQIFQSNFAIPKDWLGRVSTYLDKLQPETVLHTILPPNSIPLTTFVGVKPAQLAKLAAPAQPASITMVPLADPANPPVTLETHLRPGANLIAYEHAGTVLAVATSSEPLYQTVASQSAELDRLHTRLAALEKVVVSSQTPPRTRRRTTEGS